MPRRHLRHRPNAWLLGSSIVDLAVVVLLATKRILMAPVSPLLIAALLAMFVIYLLVIDQLKAPIFLASRSTE